MPRNGNLRVAPSRLPRLPQVFTVSYTMDGTPTDVMYMIDSSGSSIGRVERSSAGETSRRRRSFLT